MLRHRLVILALTGICAVASDAAAQTNLRAQVTGNVVTLTWSGTAQNWQVEAGTVQGTYPIVTQTGSATPGLVVPGVPNGRYYLRVRAINNGTPANTSTGAINFRVGPAPPVLSRTVTANTINLSWTGTASAWRLEAGSATGLSDIAVAGLGPANTFSAANVPPGTYFLRVRSNDGGVPGPASNEVQANVTTCIGTFRTDLHALVNGTGWRLEAGTGTGLSNLAIVPLPGAQTSLGAGLGAGKYFIRLRRNDSCGGTSNEVEVDVPGATQCPVLVPSLVAVPALATNTLNIALPAGCAWVAETGTQWITLLNTQGTSTGSVTFRFSTSTPNPPVPPGTIGEIRFRTRNGRYAMQVVQQ